MNFFLNSVNYLTLNSEELGTIIRLGGGKILEKPGGADIILENGQEKTGILSSKELNGAKP